MAHLEPWQQPQVVYYASPPMKNALGGWSLGLGVASLVFFWVPVLGLFAYVTAPAGIAFGWFGQQRAKHGVASNGGVAMAGLVCSGIALGLTVLLTALWLVLMTGMAGST